MKEGLLNVFKIANGSAIDKTYLNVQNNNIWEAKKSIERIKAKLESLSDDKLKAIEKIIN